MPVPAALLPAVVSAALLEAASPAAGRQYVVVTLPHHSIWQSLVLLRHYLLVAVPTARTPREDIISAASAV
jgi:hypothetical protein